MVRKRARLDEHTEFTYSPSEDGSEHRTGTSSSKDSSEHRTGTSSSKDSSNDRVSKSNGHTVGTEEGEDPNTVGTEEGEDPNNDEVLSGNVIMAFLVKLYSLNLLENV